MRADSSPAGRHHPRHTGLRLTARRGEDKQRHKGDIDEERRLDKADGDEKRREQATLGLRLASHPLNEFRSGDAVADSRADRATGQGDGTGQESNAKVIDAVAAGETFVVTRNGEPVAELRPLRPGRRTFITRDEVAGLAGAAVRIDHRRFRTDLDRLIDQGF
jgi:antitoxin (DNA-binding transcriptional repressor) of toxin-antitoxin stability system